MVSENGLVCLSFLFIYCDSTPSESQVARRVMQALLFEVEQKWDRGGGESYSSILNQGSLGPATQ